MILILTEESDPHADHVAAVLRRRGDRFVRFDPAQFPSGAGLSMAFSSAGNHRAQLSIGTETMDLAEVKSVWYRRPAPPVPHPEISDALTRDYVQEECNVFLRDIWNALDCFWLPAPQAVIRKAELKASQLRIAGALGFELPPTLFTNDPQEFIDFYLEHKGNVVSKLASSSLYKYTGATFNRFTQVVSRRDIAYMRSIRFCPVIFQAYVPKRVELRITVVGRQVFAAEIHSQHSNHTRHDWRRYDRYKTPYLPHDLPRDIENLCLSLVSSLGLSYGAIDMVLTPDGRYVFLEINPNGQYLWIEQMTRLPITDAICDVLASGGRMHPPSLIPVEQYAG